MNFILIKKICLSILLACFLGLILLPPAIAAPEDFYGLDKTAKTAKLDTAKTEADIPAMIGGAINYLFGVIGVIFLTVVLIGGYMWMTAGGNEEKVGKAKKLIINGINGILVMFLAYALVYIILFALQQASQVK